MTNSIYRGITYVVGPGFTEQNIINLIDTAYYIQNSPPPKFDMGSYASSTHDIKIKMNDPNYYWPDSPAKLQDVKKVDHCCGTSCCIVGTAAWHGIGDVKSKNWTDYTQKTFGACLEGDAWSYLFAGAWENYDNTTAGAMARILKFVTTGPEFIDEFVSKWEEDIGYILEMDHEEAIDELKQMYKEFEGVILGEK